VYADPLTRQQPYFVGRVLGLVEDDCGTWEGLRLRRYSVRPLGNGRPEPIEVTVLDDPCCSEFGTGSGEHGDECRTAQDAEGGAA
jgi:hypothetical protein